MRKTTILTLIAIVLLFISGCTQIATLQPKEPSNYIDNLNGEDYNDIATKTFSSKDSLLSFIKENQGSNNYYYDSFRGGSMENFAIAEAMDSNSLVKTSVSGTGNLDFSETNNQVTGVDEADILKTDGNYIYTITGNTLFIVDAYPGEDAKVISTIKFEVQPSGLFINGDTLAVFGTIYDRSVISKYGVKGLMTKLNIYDIEDRSNPELKKEFMFEGYYSNGRMKGDYVYLITNSNLEYRIDYPMPIFVEDNTLKSIPIQNIHYYDIPYNNPAFVHIHALNLNNLKENIVSESLIVEMNQNIYMSDENMYLTYTEYINEYEIQKEVMMNLLSPMLTDYENNLIKKIKSVDSDILTKYEKDNKILLIFENFMYTLNDSEINKLEKEMDKKVKERLEDLEYLEFTIINKVELDGLNINPVANGKVPGHIINQFSLDESNGNLRIATTINQIWSQYIKKTESTNNIYVLDENLEQIGKLNNLAENEQIYSARFINDRLYMVTFRQIDPFFVIDLSNPEKPKVLGELKIPGFSRYLHPYDENTIIGIGQDATESGRTQGLKISLFDVSDVSNPKEVAKYITESKYSSSTALYEHKAFLFSKEKNLMVIPAFSYNYEFNSGYNGAFVFYISKDKIELRGLIDHSVNAWYTSAVERSLYIEDLLYTKSPNLIRINNLDNLSSVQNVTLKETNSGIVIY